MRRFRTDSRYNGASNIKMWRSEAPLTEGKIRFRGTGAITAVAVVILGGALWRIPTNKTQALATSAPPMAAPAAAPLPSPKAAAPAPSIEPIPIEQASTKPASAKKTAAKPVEASAPNKNLGSKSAPVAMEVFSDYMCPACRSLFEQTLRPLINDYVASGKVYLVHHDFPLAIPAHVYSYQAARWATAAAEIGKFEEVDGALFDNQAVWSADGNIEKVIQTTLNKNDFDRVKKLMAGCGYEVPPLFKLQASGEAAAGQSCSLDAYIEADKVLGNKVPVTQTPTYVITNKGNRLAPGAGYVSWPILKQFFDSLGN